MSRGLIIGATVVAFVLVGGAIFLALSFKSMIRDRVIAEAKKRGVDIDPRDVDVWFGSATLTNTKIRLDGVSDLEAHAGNIDVLLDGLKPTRVAVDDLQVELTGSATDLALQASLWTARHPAAYEAPFSARAVDVVWRSESGSKPWLRIEDGRFSDSTHGLRFETESAHVLGVAVGAVGAAWNSDSDSIQMALGDTDPEAAPLHIAVDHATEAPSATFRLRPTPLRDLSGPLGVTLPVEEDVTAQGTAKLFFERALEAGPIAGTLEAELDGYVPPHPIELSGFFFGGSTTFSTDLAISEDRRKVTLSNSRVAAGAFELQGGGFIERVEDHATVTMTMKGDLACGEIADSAARARAGTVFGKLLGDAAKRVMKGSVEVRLRVVADTRDLEQARVSRSIGIGCGLKPLELPDLEKLGIPEGGRDIAERLSRDLPEMGSELGRKLPGTIDDLSKRAPPLPSSLPSVPSALPPLELPELPKQRKPKQRRQTEKPAE